jgi:hypothetical protein
MSKFGSISRPVFQRQMNYEQRQCDLYPQHRDYCETTYNPFCEKSRCLKEFSEHLEKCKSHQNNEEKIECIEEHLEHCHFEEEKKEEEQKEQIEEQKEEKQEIVLAIFENEEIKPKEEIKEEKPPKRRFLKSSSLKW